MGFLVMPSVDWFGIDTREVKMDAAHVKFGYGVTTEFAFGNNYAFVTGIEHKMGGATVDFETRPFYTTLDDSVMILDTRSYKLDYVNIPIGLKLMTNEIGYFTYFGKFGVDASFLVRARADDNGTYTSDVTENIELDDRDIFSEVSMFKVGLNVGAGAEWNFSGNTSLIFGLSYHYGFIDVFKDPDQADLNTEHALGSAFDTNAISNKVTSPLSLTGNAQFITLDIGILF